MCSLLYFVKEEQIHEMALSIKTEREGGGWSLKRASLMDDAKRWSTISSSTQKRRGGKPKRATVL